MRIVSGSATSSLAGPSPTPAVALRSRRQPESEGGRSSGAESDAGRSGISRSRCGASSLASLHACIRRAPGGRRDRVHHATRSAVPPVAGGRRSRESEWPATPALVLVATTPQRSTPVKDVKDAIRVLAASTRRHGSTPKRARPKILPVGDAGAATGGPDYVQPLPLRIAGRRFVRFQIRYRSVDPPAAIFRAAPSAWSLLPPPPPRHRSRPECRSPTGARPRAAGSTPTRHRRRRDGRRPRAGAGPAGRASHRPTC